MMEKKNYAKTQFEKQWETENINHVDSDCENYDIFPVFERYIKKGMKILESGCGLGRWVFYYHRRGYDITGLDWSAGTVKQIKAYDNSIQVLCGDVRNTTFKDNEFDVILSLGTIEHSIEGPEQALIEGYRILKRNGILIVAVPILTKMRERIYALKEPFRLLKALLFKTLSLIQSRPFDNIKTIRQKGIKGLYLFVIRDAGGYHFFEYRFPLETLTNYVSNAGFQVLEAFPAFNEDALYHDLTPFSGTWDLVNGGLQLSYFAKLMAKLFPNSFWHMAVCVAKKV